MSVCVCARAFVCICVRLRVRLCACACACASARVMCAPVPVCARAGVHGTPPVLPALRCVANVTAGASNEKELRDPTSRVTVTPTSFGEPPVVAGDTHARFEWEVQATDGHGRSPTLTCVCVRVRLCACVRARACVTLAVASTPPKFHPSSVREAPSVVPAFSG